MVLSLPLFYPCFIPVYSGIPDDRDGLFDTVQRSKNHYQKRAYQCIKCMVSLFSNCEAAGRLLASHGDLKRKWNWSVEWLGDELERVSIWRRLYFKILFFKVVEKACFKISAE